MIDPEQFEQQTAQRHSPHRQQEAFAPLARQRGEADGGIGSGNEDEDHHVIQFFEDAVAALFQIKGVIGRAGGVQPHHGQQKDAEGAHLQGAVALPCPVDQKGGHGQHRKGQTDKVGDGAAGLLQMEIVPAAGHTAVTHREPPWSYREIGFSKTYLALIISVLCVPVKSFRKTCCTNLHFVIQCFPKRRCCL